MIVWMIDTLLSTGLLICVALLLRRPLARWFGPQAAYGLWALPFLRLLLPPIVLPADLVPTSQAISADFASLASSAALVAPPVRALEIAGQIAPAIWLGGALVFLALRVITYRQMRRELLTDAQAVGVVGRIRLVQTPTAAAPVSFGVLDKVIALPPSFLAHPDAVARDLALAHEVAHHRGHDLLVNFAAQALLAAHWFNPIAWLGWRAMRRDQEAACDARVLAGRTRDERLRYAELIAHTAVRQRLGMACGIVGGTSIVHRLRSLAMPEVPPARRRLGQGLIAAGALVLPLTASISYSPARAQAPEPTVSSPPPTAVAGSLTRPTRRPERLASSQPAARHELRAAEPAEATPSTDVPGGGRDVANAAPQAWTVDESRLEQWGREYAEKYAPRQRERDLAAARRQVREQERLERQRLREQARPWRVAGNDPAWRVIDDGDVCGENERRLVLTPDDTGPVTICRRS